MPFLLRSRRWLLVMLASSALGFVALRAAPVLAAETATERSVHAALLFNFLKFSEWPAETDRHQIKICVSTSDPELMDAMAVLGERQLRGRQLIPVRYKHQADCDVIFVDTRQRWLGIAEKRTSPHALTIGSYAGFVTDGGMIEIAMQDGKVRFDINSSAAKRAGLRFYPQLLKLARRIVE